MKCRPQWKLPTIGCLLFVLVWMSYSAHAQRTVPVQQALAETDLTKRVTLLTAEVNRLPSCSAYLFRAEAYSILGHHDLATRDVARASELPPTEAAFVIATASGLVLLNAGDARGAYAEFDRAAATAPAGYIAVYSLRANAGVRLERYAEAERDLQVVLKSSPADAEALGLLADAQAGQRHSEAALATLDRALAAHPNQPAILQKKLLLLDRLGRRDEVEALAGLVTAFAPNDPLSQSNLGVVFQNAGNLPRAIEYHTRAIELYLERMKDDEFARTRADQLYTIYLNRSSTQRQLGNADAALGDLRKATDLRPRRHEAWYQIGELQVAQRNYREGIAAFEACYARNPRLPDGWVNLSFAYMEMGQRAEALRTFDRALTLPNVASKGLLLNNKGFALLELGRKAEAKASLEAAIAADPRVAMSHISLGEYYLSQNELASAKQHLSYGLSLPILDARERWTGLYQRAVIALRERAPEAAVTDLREAIAADARFGEAHERLGEALTALARWCEARGALKSALDAPLRMYSSQPSQAALLLTRLDLKRPGGCK
jgi:tetratricopeptide (TPR) repeat protein